MSGFVCPCFLYSKIEAKHLCGHIYSLVVHHVEWLSRSIFFAFHLPLMFEFKLSTLAVSFRFFCRILDWLLNWGSFGRFTFFGFSQEACQVQCFRSLGCSV